MKLLYSLLLVAVVTLLACKHQPGAEISNIKVDHSCSKDTVYFNNTILPMIVSSCALSGCHDPITMEHDIDFSNYAGIMRYVAPRSLSQSTLYIYMNSHTMPVAPALDLTDTQIALVRIWITQGAKNNTCNDYSCDSAKITYSGTIAPMLHTYCAGCHNKNAGSGGIMLDSYASAAANARNGQLIGSVTAMPGFEMMPKYGHPISAGNVAKIRRWIKDGAPNN